MYRASNVSKAFAALLRKRLFSSLCSGLTNERRHRHALERGCPPDPSIQLRIETEASHDLTVSQQVMIVLHKLRWLHVDRIPVYCCPRPLVSADASSTKDYGSTWPGLSGP